MSKKDKKLNGLCIPLDIFLQSNFSEEELKSIRNESEYYITLAELKETRHQKKFTQEELAKKAGIPRSALSRIESGKTNVTLKTLIQLANALGKQLEIRFR
ncbi:MAG: helix-turn-helix domain-containing protein [Candidatus Dojkabacteria bacterium]